MNINIDYSLYLVTGRTLLPAGMDYLDSLEKALQGGVTVVQIREKTVDTGEFISIAQQSKALCDRYSVPIIINDRVDVALAVGAVGVHLGQTDMPLKMARKLLPTGTVIGISCSSLEHARQAVLDGADYIGIGAVWDTKTKSLVTPAIGVRSVGPLLHLLAGTNIKAVAIGGLNSVTLPRTIHGCVSQSGRSLDGVAVVSGIMGSLDPLRSARELFDTFTTLKQAVDVVQAPNLRTEEEILSKVLSLMDKVKAINPLVHQITNTVVANQSANVTLALGASPIMSFAPEEMRDLSLVSNSLLVNMGTLTATSLEGIILATRFANETRKPIVFDPVGVGATGFRKTSANNILNWSQVSVIKGNAGELSALAGSSEVSSKGVDSVGPGFRDPRQFVKDLALKERCIVVMSGPKDYVSDGSCVVTLSNGHPLLGSITGSGCILGSSIATYCAGAAHSGLDLPPNSALVNGDMLVATVTGVLVLTIAAEIAVEKGVGGAGSFLPTLIDTIHLVSADDIQRCANIELWYG